MHGLVEDQGSPLACHSHTTFLVRFDPSHATFLEFFRCFQVLGAGVDVAVNIELESLSGSRLKETYKDFKVTHTNKHTPFQYARCDTLTIPHIVHLSLTMLSLTHVVHLFVCPSKVSAVDIPLKLLPKLVSSREMIVTFVDDELLIVSH